MEIFQNILTYKVRVLSSILTFLYICIFPANAEKQLNSSSQLRTADDILEQCSHMYLEATKLNTLEKKVLWQEAQQKVEALHGVVVQSDNAAWQDYYVQLIRTIIYLDPTTPIEEYRPYMSTLKKLVNTLPSSYTTLRWYAYRKINQLYILDNQPEKSYPLLEEIIKDVQRLPHKTTRDSMNLIMAMVGQLYCGDALPRKIGARNIWYLDQYSEDIRIPLAKAIFYKMHHRVTVICDSLMHTKDTRHFSQFYLTQLMYQSLQKLPKSRYNARRMVKLLAMQDSMYVEMQRERNADYSAYKELELQKRLKAELDKTSRSIFMRYAHTGSILAILTLVLIFVFWYNYRKESSFKLTILNRLHKEKQAQTAALEEAKTAYAEQRNLVRNLNHDIRVPLNALIGFSHILSSADNLSKTELDEAGHNIKQSSAQLLDMINNLLSIARVETNKMSLHMDSIQASDLILPHEWQAFSAKIAPSHTLSVSSLEASDILRTDKGHVRHIIELAVVNIVRKTHENTITITNTIHQEDKQLCIHIQSYRHQQSVSDIREALDCSKTMSDYEDADNYYLVLARMLAQLIDGRLEFQESASDALHLQLIIPLSQ